MTEAQHPQKPEETAENTPTTLNENESAAAPVEEVQAASSAAPAPTSAPIVIEQKTSGGKGLAVGALVLSLLGLGASGFLFVQGQNLLNTQKLQLEQELDKAGLGNSQNAVLLQNTLLRQEKNRTGTGQKYPPCNSKASSRWKACNAHTANCSKAA